MARNPVAMGLEIGRAEYGMNRSAQKLAAEYTPEALTDLLRANLALWGPKYGPQSEGAGIELADLQNMVSVGLALLIHLESQA